MKRILFCVAALCGGVAHAAEERDFSAGGQTYTEEWYPLISLPGSTVSTRALNMGDLELFDLPTVMRDVKIPKLIGGAVANPADYPSSFASRQGSSGCTATLLGPQVLQLAAHCVGNGRDSIIKIGTAEYTGTCTHHPSYRTDSTSDWALCKMTAVVPSVAYEVVNTEPTRVKVGDKLRLCGMGCTQPGGNDSSFGTFRCGETDVKTVTSGDNDIITKGGAALCYGDSGGSAFCVEGDKRWVCGVNSRGDIRTTSYLSAVHKANVWYTSWALNGAVKICGIHADATGCRGAAPDPGPNPLPEWCRTAIAKTEKCLYGTPREALSDMPGCQKAHGELFACLESAAIPD